MHRLAGQRRPTAGSNCRGRAEIGVAPRSLTWPLSAGGMEVISGRPVSHPGSLSGRSKSLCFRDSTVSPARPTQSSSGSRHTLGSTTPSDRQVAVRTPVALSVPLTADGRLSHRVTPRHTASHSVTQRHTARHRSPTAVQCRHPDPRPTEERHRPSGATHDSGRADTLASARLEAPR